MSNYTQRAHIRALALACFLLSAQNHAAMTYGIFEARGLAMGGATVAAGDNNNALFYNPSLLAFYDEHEEKTLDSRFLFPLIVPQLSDSTRDVEEFTSGDPDQALTGVIDQFNADQSSANAEAVVAVTASLESGLAGLGGDLTADVYVGMAGIEPSKRQGGGFFLGARIIGGGASDVTEADLGLLRAYQEGLAFVASGGTEGTERPEIFEADGTLRDPNQDFDSTLEGSGAAIFELGVAMSKEVSMGTHPLAIGMNVKVMRVETFEEVQRIIDGNLGASENQDTHLTLNADVGAAKEFGSRLRLGLAIKDIVPREFDTALDTPIKLRPRPRLGAAYQLEDLQIGLDVDLARNRPLATEAATQEAALGAEWIAMPQLKVRAGIRHDLRGERDVILSLGAGTSWKRFQFDVAYADGGDASAAALQFGYAF